MRQNKLETGHHSEHTTRVRPIALPREPAGGGERYARARTCQLRRSLRGRLLADSERRARPQPASPTSRYSLKITRTAPPLRGPTGTSAVSCTNRATSRQAPAAANSMSKPCSGGHLSHAQKEPTASRGESRFWSGAPRRAAPRYQPRHCRGPPCTPCSRAFEKAHDGVVNKSGRLLRCGVRRVRNDL
jgi:hypothetical protein